MKVAIGSDHKGIQLKAELVQALRRWGHEVVDVGAYSVERCDYPDYAVAVTRHVRHGTAERGILICATGVGMCLSAGKEPGIRPVLAQEQFVAESSRRHNDTNVLCLGAAVVAAELAQQITAGWLETEYEGGRHQVRLDKIAAREVRWHGQPLP